MLYIQPHTQMSFMKQYLSLLLQIHYIFYFIKKKQFNIHYTDFMTQFDDHHN